MSDVEYEKPQGEYCVICEDENGRPIRLVDEWGWSRKDIYIKICKYCPKCGLMYKDLSQ